MQKFKSSEQVTVLLPSFGVPITHISLRSRLLASRACLRDRLIFTRAASRLAESAAAAVETSVFLLLNRSPTIMYLQGIQKRDREKKARFFDKINQCTSTRSTRYAQNNTLFNQRGIDM